MRYITPLRYPGGKSKLASFMKLIFDVNNLIDGHYVEPYAGGAGIALNLLFSGYTDHVHLNDLDRSIYTFWYSVLEDTDNICRLIYDTPVNMNSWKKQKTIQKHAEDYSLLDLGFSTFFLNRTNRSGIISGGVIGGKNQNGNWTLDARYNKNELISRIEKISRYKDRVSLYNKDAAKFIIKIAKVLTKKSLIYLDPPYYIKGHDLYQNHYVHNDHVVVSNLVANIKQKWIVSYDNTPEIKKLYCGYRKISYQLSYSAADRYKGSEIMYFCDDLKVPSVDNPVKVKNRWKRNERQGR